MNKLKISSVIVFLFLSFSYVVVGDNSSFILSSTADSPDSDGNYTLLWVTSFETDNYTIYEYDGYIVNINNSLNVLLYNIPEQYINIINKTDGIYYYIIKTTFEDVDTLSNCIKIVVGEANTYNNFQNILTPVFWIIGILSVVVIVFFIYIKYKADKEETHIKRKNSGLYSKFVKIQRGFGKIKYKVKKTGRKIKDGFLQDL